ncbi:hypothetical protein [Pseudomonas lurida]|uniref:Uncharacterized protein n=1 Tax=Pseudomonas lurida TaxID=244566 RepID=A0ABY9FQX9_9PSED|nr:hypothetical protein [Pseudomonas lurida]WLH05726.1 hypothetical protein PSH67_23240 [Pseudomonas lurida]
MNKNAPPVEKKQKFSTREWCLVIAILSLVQFFIHWVSYQFGGSPNALGYISFAGTLVSIMLGLIAIIYSFVQSISQNTSVIEIRDQVERLIIAGNEISESGRIIHSASQEVNELVGDLASKVTENTSTTKEVFGRFNKLTSELSMSSIRHSKEDRLDRGDVSQEVEKSIIYSDRIISRLMILCIHEVSKRDLKIDQIEGAVFEKLAIKLDVSAEYLSGVFNAILFSLEMEGYVTLADNDIEEEKINLTEEFKVKVKELIPDSMNGETPQFTNFWLAMNEIE